MRSAPKGAHLTTRWHPRWRHAGLVTAGIVAAGITVAACTDGPSSPRAGGLSADGSTPATGLLAYSSCVRSHGVPSFPDPASSGGIPKESSQQLGVSLSVLEAAQGACQHLIPAGQSLSGQTRQTVTGQQQEYYLKAATCMRSHGITNFPEPVFSGGQVEFPQLQRLVDVGSPQFTRAYHVCQKLIPAGLPFSGSAG